MLLIDFCIGHRTIFNVINVFYFQALIKDSLKLITINSHFLQKCVHLVFCLLTPVILPRITYTAKKILFFSDGQPTGILTFPKRF